MRAFSVLLLAYGFALGWVAALGFALGWVAAAWFVAAWTTPIEVENGRTGAATVVRPR